MGIFSESREFYNVATKEEEYADWEHPSENTMKITWREFSCTCSKLSETEWRVFFDEPEAALSPQRQLTLLMEIHACARQGSQFIIVTHSPILLGIPEAQIIAFDEEGIHEYKYEETESYMVTEMFINNREQLLRRLLSE